MGNEFSNSEKQELVSRDIIRFLMKNPNYPRHKITNLKGKLGKKYDLNNVIKNATILKYANDEERKILIQLLRRRKTRTSSGVSVIAIMTEPLPCPGECIYCPGSDSQPNEKVAQSYTGQEPAALRSIHNHYDPFKQVESRINDLEAIGHQVDKIELIIMGGTFLSTERAYQRKFIKGAYEGVLGRKTNNLEEALDQSEKSQKRVIGLTVETRPDYCKENHVDLMLSYGVTRVEIGVQTVYDDIFKLVNRGHTTKDSKEAIRIARDAGLKINTHIMPNLPGSTIQKDLDLFNQLFSDPDYRPDMLKIYPCLVIKGTKLYEWWKENKFQPYSIEQLVDLLATVKENLPPYVRIQRIMRDIPAPLIEAGCDKSNLRQLVQERLTQKGTKCKCIRCREYGIGSQNTKYDNDKLNQFKLNRIDYNASEGKEIFLSFEREDLLLGYLRLRYPSEQAHRPELSDGKTLIVREVRVVGEIVPTNSDPERFTQVQHRGFGKMLMDEAEKISLEEFDALKLNVISGIGAREWFYDLGYKVEGPYVSKKLA